MTALRCTCPCHLTPGSSHVGPCRCVVRSRLDVLYDPSVEQPRPTPRDNVTDIQGLVMADIAARREVGIQRYGTPLQPHNGRDALRDLYDELLDAACYARQLIEERDHDIN
jgi:hypothetical protein